MIQATPTLSPEDERALVAAAQGGDGHSLAALVQAHVRYLRAEARKYAAAEPLIQEDDLVSAGVEAFLGAVATFDPARGARLLTHARPSIGLAMAEEVATTGRTITVPGRTLRKYRKALRETSSVEEARDLAQRREGMDPSTFDAIHFAMTGGESLDSSVGSTNDIGQGGAVKHGRKSTGEISNVTGERIRHDTPLLGSRGPSPESTESAVTARALTRDALAQLDDRQRQIVALAYLYDDLSDAQIADRLGLSRPTVTRARNAALTVMREFLGASA